MICSAWKSRSSLRISLVCAACHARTPRAGCSERAGVANDVAFADWFCGAGVGVVRSMGSSSAPPAASSSSSGSSLVYLHSMPFAWHEVHVGRWPPQPLFFARQAWQASPRPRLSSPSPGLYDEVPYLRHFSFIFATSVRVKMPLGCVLCRNWRIWAMGVPMLSKPSTAFSTPPSRARRRWPDSALGASAGWL